MKSLLLLPLIASCFLLQSCFEPTVTPGYGGGGGSYGSSASKERSPSETIRKVRQMSGNSLRRGY